MSIFASLFQSKSSPNLKTAEPARLPECTNAEYDEFLACMRRGERKFQTAGRTLRDEYAAWLKDYRRRMARSDAAAKRATSNQPAPEITQQA